MTADSLQVNCSFLSRWDKSAFPRNSGFCVAMLLVSIVATTAHKKPFGATARATTSVIQQGIGSALPRLAGITEGIMDIPSMSNTKITKFRQKWYELSDLKTKLKTKVTRLFMHSELKLLPCSSAVIVHVFHFKCLRNENGMKSHKIMSRCRLWFIPAILPFLISSFLIPGPQAHGYIKSTKCITTETISCLL